MPSALITELLDAFDRLAGGVHAGFRPVHAKGQMYSGTFTPEIQGAYQTEIYVPASPVGP
jgi:catalase